MGEIINIKTIAEAKQLVRERGLSHVKVAVCDIDGILRGKYMGIDKFMSSLDKGFGFCDVIFGWDMHDKIYDQPSYTGWDTAFPDGLMEILPQTARNQPLEGGDMVMFLAQSVGSGAAVDPRATLQRVVDKAKNMGFGVHASVEYEFFMFQETRDSVRAKNYRSLQNMTPDPFGYSVLRMNTHAELYHEIINLCANMRMELEGLHTETGPGVLEAAIKYSEAMEAGDRAVLFKTFMKSLAQRHNLMATFMAKWSNDWPGQSGHIHTSLYGIDDKKSVFYSDKNPDNISDTMRWYIGGQQKLMPELLAMIASTVNSYTRLIPGYWAPTSATWGIENRTCALRVIKGSPSAQRVEYRIAAADINPYIALACVIGSGLYGIEHKIEPTAPIKGNAYSQKIPASLNLPRNLYDAAQRLRKSKAAAALFGQPFRDHYAITREHEHNESHKAITDWMLRRYFEII